ncbi:MAG: glycosyltransferase [Acidimicrobiales bacterium]
MRIAVISTMDGLDWGGSEELWTAMANAALTAGHDVLVSVNRWERKPAPVVALERAGAEIHPRSRVRQRALYRSQPPVALPFPLRRLRRFDPDVVCLSHGATWDVARDPGMFASLGRYLGDRRVPYVPVCQYNTSYDPLTDDERRRARAYFGGAATVAFVAAANRDAAERLIAERLPRTVLIQNPVTVTPTVLPWPTGSVPAFACVARLDAGAKGQDILLEALAADGWRAREWRLTLYGAGPHLAWLRAIAHHYELDRRVTFGGHAPDIVAIWRRHHMLVLPSRAEGTPLSLLEAMALARPSVVTDVGGNREWVDPDETGFVAAAATAASIGDALETSWKARDRWRSMGLKAHEALVQRYDPTPGATLLHLLQQASGQLGPRALPS